ncbi:hypothetical protein [Actinomadura sp. NPDC000600]|uniref:hypothetical protein n=1 Tax=Actinomadura sp. NPDC000600 TaxID=3154262 RepID=UPI0033971A76
MKEKERRRQYESTWGDQRNFYRQPFYFPEGKPRKRYHCVLFVARRKDGRLVFTTPHGELRPYAPDEAFERRPRRTQFKRSIERMAACLSDLLYLVEGDTRPEEEIIDALNGDYSAAEIGQALRAALSAGLLKRPMTLKRALHESVSLAHLTDRFHPLPLRKLELTERGTAWIQVDRHPKGNDMKDSENDNSPHFNFFGDVSFTESSVTGDVNKTTYINNSSAEIDEVLRQAISLIRANEAQLQRFTDYTAELVAAADVLQAAILQGDVRTPRARQALNVMIRAGEGLFLGVAGNTMYDQLKEVLQMLSH